MSQSNIHGANLIEKTGEIKTPRIRGHRLGVPIVENVDNAYLQFTDLKHGLYADDVYIEYTEDKKRKSLTIPQYEAAEFLRKTFNERGYGYNDILGLYHNAWTKKISLPRHFRWVSSMVVLTLVLAFKSRAVRIKA